MDWEREKKYKEPTEQMKIKGPDKILENIALYNGHEGRALSYIL
jgi:hypothetical protein